MQQILLTATKINFYPNRNPPNFPAKNPTLILQRIVQATKNKREGRCKTYPRRRLSLRSQNHRRSRRLIVIRRLLAVRHCHRNSRVECQGTPRTHRFGPLKRAGLNSSRRTDHFPPQQSQPRQQSSFVKWARVLNRPGFVNTDCRFPRLRVWGPNWRSSTTSRFILDFCLSRSSHLPCFWSDFKLWFEAVRDEKNLVFTTFFLLTHQKHPMSLQHTSYFNETYLHWLQQSDLEMGCNMR
jgi:hypothetical protein